jgi:hypothetical protein
MAIRKSDIKIIRNMAIRLKRKIIDSVCDKYEGQPCKFFCPFGEYGCAQLDAENIIQAIEKIKNELHA